VIEEKLKETEAREGVRILYCAASGSRARSFASPDSDYDDKIPFYKAIKATA